MTAPAAAQCRVSVECITIIPQARQVQIQHFPSTDLFVHPWHAFQLQSSCGPKHFVFFKEKRVSTLMDKHLSVTAEVLFQSHSCFHFSLIKQSCTFILLSLWQRVKRSPVESLCSLPESSPG